MEINQRMSKRFAWMLGVAMLVSIGLLVACGSNYNASSDGLMLVGSQGSGLVETFSFNLGSGHVSAISNTPNDTSTLTCVLNGVPSSLVVDPAGAYAYTIINYNPACPGSKTGIQAFKVNSDGTTKAAGSFLTLNATNPTVMVSVEECGNPVQEAVTVTQPVSPVTMVIDSAGKNLFIADGSTATTAQVTYTCPGQQPTTVTVNVPVPGTVSAISIGGGGSLSEATGSPFSVPVLNYTPNLVAVAATPTVLPAVGINGVRNAVCNDLGNNPPTSEYLYTVDSQNNLVWEFAVNTSTGALGYPGTATVAPSFTTDPIPEGVAVDPCNRFVYVSDSLTNRVSAYAICNGSTTSPAIPCAPLVPGALVEVTGSPFGLSGSANSPGPLVVDAFGNFVYVVGTLSNTVSVLRISPISGSLTASSPATVATGIGPKAIAIRADDSWMFVTNFGSSSLGGNTVTQYLVTPQSGALTVQPPVQTDNYPWGVAVK